MPKRKPATHRLEAALIAAMNAMPEVPNWFQLSVLRLVRRGVERLRDQIEDPNDLECTWKTPFAECRIKSGYDFERHCAPKLDLQDEEIPTRSPAFETFCDQLTLRVLTKCVSNVKLRGEEPFYEWRKAKGEGDPTLAEHWELAREHFTIAPVKGGRKLSELSEGFLALDDFDDPRPRHEIVKGGSREIEPLLDFKRVRKEKLGDLLDKLRLSLSFDEPCAGLVLVRFLPQVIGEEPYHRAYYRVWAGLGFYTGESIDSKTWTTAKRHAPWKGILKRLDEIEQPLLEPYIGVVVLRSRVKAEDQALFKDFHQARLDNSAMKLNESGELPKPGRPRKYTEDLHRKIEAWRYEGLTDFKIAKRATALKLCSAPLTREMIKSARKNRRKRIQQKAR